MGQRFINAYNLIDHSLRVQYNFKTNITFSDLIRRCSTLNQLIRVYEDDLIELARLRNAIVHNRSERLIAEPHEDIVELMERIAQHVSAPPLAIDVIKSVSVSIIPTEAKVRDFFIMTYKVGHSNIPVYNVKNELVGVMRRDVLMQALGKIVENGGSIDHFIENTTIEQYMREFPYTSHFCIASAQITIEEVLSLFENNRKLSCIIVTQTGAANSQLKGIITVGDLIDLKYWNSRPGSK